MFDFDFSSIYSNLESLCKSSLDNGCFTNSTIAGFVEQGTFDAAGYKRITGDDYVAGNQTTVANSQT
ncbi:XkdX family protein [Lactobacillus johnsonii]|uniref:XkdX family protein n=1 Tax=Lactobacillaceae TaxID=33958 RepID=UPI000D6FB8B7|nr:MULTISPECIES: XkdX family protein [Lactobacillaceae]AXQ19318.1 XkdX family protein [Lactobacillus johnsonii]PWT39968.1 XkdX family protein [Limosilactobacillus reuteri]